MAIDHGTVMVLLSAVASLSLTIAAMVALRPIAYLVDLLDRPGGHKTHSGAVPVVGGLAMLLGIMFGVAIAAPASNLLSSFVISATVLVIVGLFDDRFNVAPATRLIAQFVAVLPMVFGAGVAVHRLGDPFGTGHLELGAASLAFTALVTMASINAFNMLDGLDGLAGGVALVSLLGLLLLGAPAIGPVQLLLTAVVAGAVIGFLCFNAPVQANRRIRCFMGDAGSTLLGFALAWLAIDISQRPTSTVAPVTMIWMIGVPATDLVSTVIRRVARGRSPLLADKEHLHHRLLGAGLGVRAVFVVMMLLSLGMCGMGAALQRLGVPDSVSLAALFGVGGSVVLFCRNARIFVRFVPPTLRRLQPVEGFAAAEAPESGRYRDPRL